MRTAALVLVPLVVVSIARAAEAECAMPTPAMAAEATPLPPDPWLYRFELSYRAATELRIVSADGSPVQFAVREMNAPDGLRVQEIRIAAKRGTFTVHGLDHEPPRTYTIAPRRAAYAAPVVDAVSWSESAWTCSHEIGMVVEARGEGVVAFRAEWTDGTEAMLPPNDRYFWSGAMGGEIDPSALRAFLGHPNCVTDLIPHRMIGRKDFRLFARFADGGEREVELPRASAPQPEPQPPQPPQPQPQPPPQPQPAYRAPGTIDAWKFAVATAVSIAALISVSTLLVARRRRRNAMIVP